MDIEQLLKEGPSLTLNPEEEFSDLVVKEPQKEEVQAGKAYEEEKYLTDAEKKQVDAFVKEIELKDSAAILQYGSGIQKKMSDFSEGTLNKVRNKDLGEIGELLSGVVTELKEFDEEESKGVFGFFKKKMAKAEALKLKYDKAEISIEKVSKTLEGHQMQLLKDSALLDQLYDLNKVYFRELNMYILAGKKKLRQVMEEELPQARAKASASGAIRMIQSSDAMMAEKIQSTLVNTIPLWKSQMIIALGVEHSRQAAEAQREVSDFTNALLRKNAEKLKTATVETAKESERGIVDMETLIATNENLISTIDEVMRIQSEGRQKRREAEVRLTELEDQLKNKLLETSYK